ncbi:hypothetical protein Peur_041549 [Populus x canadensis]
MLQKQQDYLFRLCSLNIPGVCGYHLTALHVGIEKGKHYLCKSWPGLSSLPRRQLFKQQPYKALSASATKAAGISATFAVNYTKSLFKWLISCKYLGCFWRWCCD